MSFEFKLLQPPSDISFLSIVDGATLYNSKGKHSHDLKEATLRQVGWHVAKLPIEWFCSDRAHTTVERVLETMQCTIQYLWHETQLARQRAEEKDRALQNSNLERDNAFEELVGLRETVALYALTKHRARGGAGTARQRHGQNESPVTEEGLGGGGGGLTCTLCGNEYPSKSALESHFRKRHKRTREFAAMASAQAATTQAVNVAKKTPAHLYVDLPNTDGARGGDGRAMESRGVLAMREELSELRLTIAKLVEQKAEQQRAMAPTHMVAHPAAGGLPCLESDPLEANNLSNKALAEQMTALKELVLRMNERLEQSGNALGDGASPMDGAVPSRNRGKRLGIPPPLEQMSPAFVADTNYDSIADINVSPMTQRSPSTLAGRRPSLPQTLGNSQNTNMSGPRQVVAGMQTPQSSVSTLGSSGHSATVANDAGAKAPDKAPAPLTPELQPDVHFSLPMLPKSAAEYRYNEELSTVASRRETPRVPDINTSQGESGMVLSDTAKTNLPTLSSPNPTDSAKVPGSNGPEISVSPRGRPEDTPLQKSKAGQGKPHGIDSPLASVRSSKPPIPVVQLVAKDSPPHPTPSVLKSSGTPKAPESLLNSHYSLFDDYCVDVAPMQTSALADKVAPSSKKSTSPQQSFATSDTEARKLADENVPAFGQELVNRRVMASSSPSSSSDSSLESSSEDARPVQDVENADLDSNMEEITLESQTAETDPANRSREEPDEEQRVDLPALKQEESSSSSYSYYYTYSEEGEESDDEGSKEQRDTQPKMKQRDKPKSSSEEEESETNDEEEEGTATDDRKSGKGADVKAGLKKFEGTLKNKMSKFKKLFDKKKKK